MFICALPGMWSGYVFLAPPDGAAAAGAGEGAAGAADGAATPRSASLRLLNAAMFPSSGTMIHTSWN